MQPGDSWENGTAALDHAEPDSLSEYRSVSKFAVLAVIAGLASILAWAHALMWFVPIVAMVLAWLAFREISNSDGGLSGRGAAMLGLAMALVFGVGAVTKYLTERQVVIGQSKQFAERFLQLTKEGELDHAAQLTEPFEYRVTPGQSLEQYYQRQPESKISAEHFVTDDFAVRLAEAGADAKLTLLRIVQFEKIDFGHRCTFSYRVEDKEPFDVHIRVRRIKNPEVARNTHWQVRQFKIAED